MEIKPADISDARAILELQKVAYITEAELYDDYSIEPLTQTMEGMTEDFSRQRVLKAIEDGKIVGSVRAEIEGNKCVVRRLIVHPNFRNCGIGTALMNELEKMCPDAEIFELFTGWKSANNIHLYEKLGYICTGIKEINQNLKFVYMEKKNLK